MNEVVHRLLIIEVVLPHNANKGIPPLSVSVSGGRTDWVRKPLSYYKTLSSCLKRFERSIPNKQRANNTFDFYPFFRFQEPNLLIILPGVYTRGLGITSISINPNFTEIYKTFYAPVPFTSPENKNIAFFHVWKGLRIIRTKKNPQM